MGKSSLYVPLDVSYHEDEKILLAGEKAELLYVRGLCLVKRILSDGLIADVHLPRFGLTGVQARARKLVEVGLWQRVEGGYVIVAWSKHNKSAEEVAEIKAKRQVAGKQGGKRSGEARREANAKQVGSANGKQPANPEAEAEAEAEAEETLGAAARTPRKPDLLFEAVVDACGLDVAEMTKSSRGAANRAVKELREIGATPDGVRARARVHRQRWADVDCTPSSLAKNYAQLGVSKLAGDRGVGNGGIA